MGAVFSPCRTWRYRLSRMWSEGPVAGFILLNPSTADETKDDPTIRRCIGFAKRWGFGGLILGNAFAYRSTDPMGLRTVDDPVGPENDAALAEIVRDTTRVVCGWGVHGVYRDRQEEVLRIIRENGGQPLALKVVGGGCPGHPLYIAGATEPVLFEGFKGFAGTAGLAP